MTIDTLIDKVIKYHNQSDFDELLKFIHKVKLYFYIIDDGTFTGLEEIVNVGKNRPVSIPIIKRESKTISVIYTSKKIAIDRIQDGFKISYTINGIDAIKFQHSAKGVNEIVLQGRNGHLILDEYTINKLIKLEV